MSDAADSDAKSADRRRPRGNGQRILFVDDAEPLVRLTTERLNGLGYQPTGFTSAAAAIEAFRTNPQDFDAVITDERMPGMSGSALIHEVRACAIRFRFCSSAVSSARWSRAAHTKKVPMRF
jgi:CheY-like chemotaxis protein